MKPSVNTEHFKGPLDVLLDLVQAQEVQLTRLSLAEVLSQVIEELKAEHDLSEGGDILIIIATLMELKSRLLLPGEVNLDEEISALREDLLEKLLVHRRLSQVLDALEYRMERRSKMFSRPGLEGDREEVLIPMEHRDPQILYILADAIRETARTDTFRKEYILEPIDSYYRWIHEMVYGQDFTLLKLAAKRRDALDVAGLLVAILEMIRKGVLHMKTTKLGEEIYINWVPPEEREERNDMNDQSAVTETGVVVD